MSAAPAIGIDLGTTFSAAAIYRDGKSEIIPTHHGGDHLVPSFVYYDPESLEVCVGKNAEMSGIDHKQNLLQDIKRTIGRKYDDIYVQKLLNSGELKYRIVEGEEGNAEIEIKHDGLVIRKTPEQASSEVLRYLKEAASEFLRAEVTEAVVSVPAHFSNAQRRATKAAAELAGLQVLKLVTEPVAAAIHYSMDKIKTPSTLLVFDFGGGTLDVSIVRVNNKQFEVKSVDGDTFLGGRDFDRKLFDHIWTNISDQIQNSGNTRAAGEDEYRLTRLCRQIKIYLTNNNNFSRPFFLYSVGKEHRISVSRQEFETLTNDLFTRAIDLVTRCLDEAQLPKTDIDQVVLVGGTTRLPRIREMLGSHFGTEKLRMDLNPDEAVVLGAAVQAAMLKEKFQELEKYKVTEVTPLSLGFELYGGLFKSAIKKNTALPAKSRSIRSVTSRNNQTYTCFDIYEGERKNCDFNNKLGSFRVYDLPPGRAGTVKFETIFSLDENGILKVESRELSTGQNNKLAMTIREYRLSEKIIKRTKEEAKKHREDDENFGIFVKVKSSTTQFCYDALYNLEKISNISDKTFVEERCNDFLEFANKLTHFTKIKVLYKLFEFLLEEIYPIIKDIMEVNI